MFAFASEAVRNSVVNLAIADAAPTAITFYRHMGFMQDQTGIHAYIQSNPAYGTPQEFKDDEKKVMISQAEVITPLLGDATLVKAMSEKSAEQHWVVDVPNSGPRCIIM